MTSNVCFRRLWRRESDRVRVRGRHFLDALAIISGLMHAGGDVIVLFCFDFWGVPLGPFFLASGNDSGSTRRLGAILFAVKFDFGGNSSCWKTRDMSVRTRLTRRQRDCVGAAFSTLSVHEVGI